MRLIDADAFENYVRKHCKDSLADLWRELIRRQPTAYDVDRVVGQMQEFREEGKCPDNAGFTRCAFTECQECKMGEAARIVKEGGTG